MVKAQEQAQEKEAEAQRAEQEVQSIAERMETLATEIEAARQVGLRGRPRREKLSSTDWALFDELVENDEIKEELRHFFEIDGDL